MKKKPEQAGFYKIKYGNVFAVLGVLLAIWLLSSARLKELRDVSISIGIGLVIYLLVSITKKK